MQHKKCTKCGGFKPLTDFYKSKRGMDGRRSDCKLCSLIYMKDRYYNEPGVKDGNNTDRGIRWDRYGY